MYSMFFTSKYKENSMNTQYIKTKQLLEHSYINCVHKYTEPIPHSNRLVVSCYTPR